MIEIYSPEARAMIDRAVRRVLAEPGRRRERVPASSTGAMYIAKVGGSAMGARSTDTPGSATVTLQRIDSTGDLSDQLAEDGTAVTVTAHNLSVSTVAADGYVMLLQCQLSGYYWVVWEDC